MFFYLALGIGQNFFIWFGNLLMTISSYIREKKLHFLLKLSSKMHEMNNYSETPFMGGFSGGDKWCHICWRPFCTTLKLDLLKTANVTCGQYSRGGTRNMYYLFWIMHPTNHMGALSIRDLSIGHRSLSDNAHPV